MYNSNDVTVYIPYNGEGTLFRCLDGLLAQTAFPASIVVIDNCSDERPEIDEFISGRSECPVDVVKMPERSCLAAVRNMAVELCSTKLIASLDPDMIPSPDWIEMMVEAIAPRCHCLAEKKDRICGIGGKTDYIIPDSSKKAEDSEPLNWGDAALDDPQFVWSSNALFKVESIEAAGGYSCDAENPDLTLAESLYASGGVILYMPSIKCGLV